MELRDDLTACLESLKPLYARPKGNYYFDCSNGVVAVGGHIISVEEFVNHVVPDLVRNGFAIGHIGATQGDPHTGTYIARKG